MSWVDEYSVLSDGKIEYLGGFRLLNRSNNLFAQSVSIVTAQCFPTEAKGTFAKRNMITFKDANWVS